MRTVSLFILVISLVALHSSCTFISETLFTRNSLNDQPSSIDSTDVSEVVPSIEKDSEQREVLPDSIIIVTYGAQEVGTLSFQEKKVYYDEYDYDEEMIFIEKIKFRGIDYTFKFQVINGLLRQLTMLRYSKSGYLNPSNSYAILSDRSGVVHTFFNEQGEPLRKVAISDQQIIRNTVELFGFCNQYFSTYFMMIEDKKARSLRKNRVQSLGYELLQYERI